LVNRTDKPARYLEIGNRSAEDVGGYSDADLAMHKDASGKAVFTRTDGSRY
jgi:uncharacterized cupin superfamily protein